MMPCLTEEVAPIQREGNLPLAEPCDVTAGRPPGAGIHGMGGFNAAQSVLAGLGRN